MSKSKIWFEGVKTYNIIFTDEDLQSTLAALNKLSNDVFFTGEELNKYAQAKIRILFQLRGR